MAEITKKVLVLTFQTAKGKEASLTINAPEEGLEGTSVSEAMDAVIEAAAYGEGDLAVTKGGAKYVIQQVEAIEI